MRNQKQKMWQWPAALAIIMIVLALAGCKELEGEQGTAGVPGPATVPRPVEGLNVVVAASTPPNGTHFNAGESIVFTITAWDDFGAPVYKTDLAYFRIYMAGPDNPQLTKTAFGLMGTAAAHAAVSGANNTGAYVDLLTTTASNLVVNGNVFTFTTDPVSTEDAGTYTVGIRSRLPADPVTGLELDKGFQLANFEIGTATAETSTVERRKCAACHLGASNGVFYMHHVDGGLTTGGSFDIDSFPPRTCKLCHNNEGYAYYRACTTGTDNGVPDPAKDYRRPASGACEDRDSSGSADAYVGRADDIVRRVHGIHMGQERVSVPNTEDKRGLRNIFNTDETIGDFRDYVRVGFPAEARNCTKCHTTDSWKNNPSRLACGACHDNVRFDVAVADFVGPTYPTYTGEIAHPGGVATSDGATCLACHNDGIAKSPTTAHTIPALDPEFTIGLTMSAPAAGGSAVTDAGGLYVAGDKPVITMVLKDKATGLVTVDPSIPTWNTLDVFVSGPRARAIPVLTNAARAEVTSVNAGTFAAMTDAQTLTVQIDGGVNTTSTANTSEGVDLTLTVNCTTFATLCTGATAAEVAAWMNANTSFSAVALAVANANNTVSIRSKPSLHYSAVQVTGGTGVNTQLAFPTTLFVPVAGSASYAENVLTTDPKATIGTANITYQLDDVAGLASGTYTVFARAKCGTAQAGCVSGAVARSLGWINFQVGAAKEEANVAENCRNCHDFDNRWHEGSSNYPFISDVCAACHDYKQNRFQTGGGVVDWSTRNYGYGTGPLSRRLHGLHFGNYLDKPTEVHSSYPVSTLIWPQDVRNCATCHAQSSSIFATGLNAASISLGQPDVNGKMVLGAGGTKTSFDAGNVDFIVTSGTHFTNPNRLACNGCHDSDAAIAHGATMTFDPTPANPYSGDEQEGCGTCHGVNGDFGVEKVHNISSPFKAIYPRDPSWLN